MTTPIAILTACALDLGLTAALLELAEVMEGDRAA